MILFINMLERLALWVSRFISSLAAMVLFFIVLLTCANVIFRYFLHSPLLAAEEMIAISMAGVIFFSLPLMFFRHDHIVVDLFPIFQRGNLGRFLSIIFLAITAYCLWAVADKVWFYAMRSLEDNDTYEYILKPKFLQSEFEQQAPKFIVDTFIALSLYLVSFLTVLRLLLVIVKPGTNAETSVGLE
jgi:TRAP-type C4-dicarboxylate transport system permease small subunit